MLLISQRGGKGREGCGLQSWVKKNEQSYTNEHKNKLNWSWQIKLLFLNWIILQWNLSNPILYKPNCKSSSNVENICWFNLYKPNTCIFWAQKLVLRGSDYTGFTVITCLFHISSKYDLYFGVDMVMCHAIICIKEIYQSFTW